MCNKTKLYMATWAEQMATDIAAARESITIASLSCILPTPKATGKWQELYSQWKEAAKRGLHVEIYLPSPHTQHPATRQNITAAKQLAEVGIHTRFVNPTKLLHIKTCVIDERVLWVGSGNMTGAAINHNHEAYIRTVSEHEAAQMLGYMKVMP